ncbi:MAG: condensation domain-containing protein, partial [Bacteroidota bacterium]
NNDQTGFDHSSAAGIPVAATQPAYPLTSAQQSLWALSLSEQGSLAYNISGVYVLEATLDVSALTRAFHSLIERHEILRTLFREDEAGDIKQYIRKSQEQDFDISITDFRAIPETEWEPFIHGELPNPCAGHRTTDAGYPMPHRRG